MKTTWVVVADEAIARILQWPEVGDELEPVEELTDPDAHAANAEFRNDAYGRRSGGADRGQSPQQPGRLRPTASVTASAGEVGRHREAEDFAQEVAKHLAGALQDKRYDELRVVAAPRFLGLLRKAYTPQVAQTVVQELDKDLVHADNAEITRRLFPMTGGLAAPGVPRHSGN